MKLGIFSDLHGNHATLEHALSAFQCEFTDSIVCLGDVLGKSGDTGNVAIIGPAYSGPYPHGQNPVPSGQPQRSLAGSQP